MTKEEMYSDIRKWKKEKNAIILAHYFVLVKYCYDFILVPCFAMPQLNKAPVTPPQ